MRLGKVVIVIAMAVTILGCSARSQTQFGADFDRSNENMQLVVILYDSTEALDKAYFRTKSSREKKVLRRKVGQIKGWAAWTNKPPYKCELHLPRLNDERTQDMFVTWGHELSHCIYGEWHK